MLMAQGRSLAIKWRTSLTSRKPLSNHFSVFGRVTKYAASRFIPAQFVMQQQLPRTWKSIDFVPAERFVFQVCSHCLRRRKWRKNTEMNLLKERYSRPLLLIRKGERRIQWQFARLSLAEDERQTFTCCCRLCFYRHWSFSSITFQDGRCESHARFNLTPQ